MIRLDLVVLKNTLADAREIDKTINIDNVKKWFDSNVEQKKQLLGSNSFIPNGNKYEYQIDLFLLSIYKIINMRQV